MKIKRKQRKLTNTWRAIRDVLERRARLLSRPLALHLEINDFCNLKCFMCPREADDIEKDTANMPLDVVRAVEPLMEQALYVGLVGNGEPFIHPELFDVIEMIQRHEAVPTLITNGTLLREKHFDALVGDRPLLLQFSIDGGTKPTFESIRIRADFDKVVAGMEALVERKRAKGAVYPVLAFIVCLMKENLYELDKIVELGAKFGVGAINVQKLYPYIDSVKEHCIEDHAECRRVAAQAQEQARKHGIDLRFQEMGDSIDVRLAGENGGRPGRFFCEYAWQKMHIGLKGDARVCCFWTHGELGNVLDTDAAELWNNEVMVDARRKILTGDFPPDCAKCHMVCPHRRIPLVKQTYAQAHDVWKR
ncbi:radical SAM protein [Candidatus Sumerlaeota bacterium]|nr:radical SAM protein [Candidatus Sumerlaeota bacterium]